MINQQTFKKYAENPSAFRDDLLVDVSGLVHRFGSVMDPWQRDDFERLDPALKLCVGRSDKPAKTRAYLERARGHSKTTDLAVMCCWAEAFANRPIRGYCFAADKDQATILKDAMATIIRLNPWLSNILSVQKNEVINIAEGHPGHGSKLEIFTSDVGSSFGILPDLIIADELVHWQGDGSLWHSLISSAAKRTNCLMVIISNAGFADSWQWNVREAARTDDDWIFSRLEGSVASWLSEKRLAEQKRMLPPVAYSRLWENVWSSGGGDALRPEDIDASFFADLQPQTKATNEYTYVSGLDLGVSRDASAVCVLGIRRGHETHGKIRLAYTKTWKPIKGKKVNLQEVENALFDIHHRFNLKRLNFDPWQATHMASRLQSGGMGSLVNGSNRKALLPMVEVPPVGKNLQAMATTVIEAFNDRRLELFEEPNLKRDLKRLRVEERSYGFRLVSPRDEHGHGDLATAFSLAMLAATELAAKKIIQVGAIRGDQSSEMNSFEKRKAALSLVESSVIQSSMQFIAKT